VEKFAKNVLLFLYNISMRDYKIIIEKHPDGFVAYPLGLKGVVVAQGNSYDEALANVKSAIAFHIESFGSEVLEDNNSVLDAYIAETSV